MLLFANFLAGPIACYPSLVVPRWGYAILAVIAKDDCCSTCEDVKLAFKTRGWPEEPADYIFGQCEDKATCFYLELHISGPAPFCLTFRQHHLTHDRQNAPREFLIALNICQASSRRFCFQEKWPPSFWKPLTSDYVAQGVFFSRKMAPRFLKAPTV